MTNSPPAGSGPAAPPPAGSKFFDSIRRAGLWRAQDRWFGGVAAGVATRLGWDPLLVRGLFILLTLLTGGGALLLYGVAWLLLPEAADGRIHFEQVIQGRWSAGFWGGVVMAFIGLTSGAGWSTMTRGFGLFLSVPLTIAALIAVAVIAATRSGQSPTQPTWVAPPPATPGGPAGANGAFPGGVQPVPASAAEANAGAGATNSTPQATHLAGTPGRMQHQSGGAPTPVNQWGPAPTTASPGWTSPTRPRRRSGGPITMALLGSMAILIAALVAADRYTSWFDSWLTPGLAIGAVLVFMGLGLVVLGLLGRRAGGFVAVSIILVVLAAPIAAMADAARAGGGHLVVGERHFTPVSMADVAEPFGLSMGQVTIDLTELDVPAGQTAHVKVNMSMGQTIVIVPSQTPVTIKANVSAGQVNLAGLSDSWKIDGTNRRGPAISDRLLTATGLIDDVAGVGVNVTALSPNANGTNPTITVTVDATIGQVSLREQPSQVG